MSAAVPTGADLVAEVRQAAARRGISAVNFVRPLWGANGWSRLNDLATTVAPTASTIAQVRGHIAEHAGGRGQIEPPRYIGRGQAANPSEFRGAPPLSQFVDRDPCGWCGTRRDVGCKHFAPSGTRPVGLAA